MIPEEKKAFNKEFWLFLLSSILIALSACLGNVVDSIIVGHLIGEDGVSAINLTKPVTQFMFTLSMLVATGAAMLVGMELGKKNTAIAAAGGIGCTVINAREVGACGVGGGARQRVIPAHGHHTIVVGGGGAGTDIVEVLGVGQRLGHTGSGGVDRAGIGGVVGRAVERICPSSAA